MWVPGHNQHFELNLKTDLQMMELFQNGHAEGLGFNPQHLHLKDLAVRDSKDHCPGEPLLV